MGTGACFLNVTKKLCPAPRVKEGELVHGNEKGRGWGKRRQDTLGEKKRFFMGEGSRGGGQKTRKKRPILTTEREKPRLLQTTKETRTMRLRDKYESQKKIHVDLHKKRRQANVKSEELPSPQKTLGEKEEDIFQNLIDGATAIKGKD